MHRCSVVQWCQTLCDCINCSLPASSVHGISQARILGWVAISSSRELYIHYFLVMNTVKDYRHVVSLCGYSSLLLRRELLLFEME